MNHDFTKFAYGKDFPPEQFYYLGRKYNKTDKEKNTRLVDDKKHKRIGFL